MPLPKLPVHGLDDVNHQRRSRETINRVLDHSFDDSRVQTTAEKLAGITPVNYAYPPGDIRRYHSSVLTTYDTALASAQAAGYQVYIPAAQDGSSYVFASAIPIKGGGVLGDGPTQTKLQFNGTNAFELSSSAVLDRRACILEGFSVDADSDGHCDANWAFYMPGVADHTSPVYNSGLIIRNIEVGRQGRFGGIFYVKDVFRLDAQSIGITSCNRMIQLVGSVAQCTFSQVRSNNDSSGSSLSSIGISTELSHYAAGDADNRTPENVKFIDCAYVHGSIGIQHTAGLNVQFIRPDTETLDKGASLNAPCRVVQGIFGCQDGANDWTGILVGINTSGVEDLIDIDGSEINTLNIPASPGSSYGIDIGDGATGQQNCHVRNCVIQGVSSSLATGIRARKPQRLVVENNAIESGLCTGTEINLNEVGRLSLKWNSCPSGDISVTDNGSGAYGEISFNEISSISLTLTTATNWDIGVNEALTTIQRAHEVGTYTGTLTGCTTSPTSTVRYSHAGKFVTIYLPTLNATSNSNSCTLTGMSSIIRPTRTQVVWARYLDNGVEATGLAAIDSGGTITLFNSAGSSTFFTASGSKGFPLQILTYSTE